MSNVCTWCWLFKHVILSHSGQIFFWPSLYNFLGHQKGATTLLVLWVGIVPGLGAGSSRGRAAILVEFWPFKYHELLCLFAALGLFSISRTFLHCSQPTVVSFCVTRVEWVSLAHLVGKPHLLCFASHHLMPASLLLQLLLWLYFLPLFWLFFFLECNNSSVCTGFTHNLLLIGLKCVAFFLFCFLPPASFILCNQICQNRDKRTAMFLPAWELRKAGTRKLTQIRTPGVGWGAQCYTHVLYK